jgi:hypothetical protein
MYRIIQYIKFWMTVPFPTLPTAPSLRPVHDLLIKNPFWELGVVSVVYRNA